MEAEWTPESVWMLLDTEICFIRHRKVSQIRYGENVLKHFCYILHFFPCTVYFLLNCITLLALVFPTFRLPIIQYYNLFPLLFIYHSNLVAIFLYFQVRFNRFSLRKSDLFK